MSNENFRNELGDAFEQMSGSPSPMLRDRVRSSIGQAPPARNNFWIAGVAAAVMAALIVGILVVTNPLHRPPTTSGPVVTSPAPSASASSGPSANPSPTATTSATPFTCVAATHIDSASTAPVAFIDSLRTGTHPGYDRLTVEFQNAQPSTIELRTQSGTAFTKSPSGQTVTLAGSNGILVTITGADLHTSYSGPTDVKTGYAALAEVRSVQDFEGVVQLGLGINGAACYRAYVLTAPTRLVIDVQSS
jgi:hypothetical protein